VVTEVDGTLVPFPVPTLILRQVVAVVVALLTIVAILEMWLSYMVGTVPLKAEIARMVVAVVVVFY
jgi:hypothetical protein